MDLSQVEKLLGLLSIVVPGVVATLVYDQLVPSERRDWSKHTVGAIAAGGTHALLLQSLVARVSHAESVHWKTLGHLVLYLLVPTLMGVLAYWGRAQLAKRGFGSHPLHTAWDHLLGSSNEAWVRVRLKDGHYVAGRWSGRSFAGSASAKRDLLLDHATPVSIDGATGTPLVPRVMIWIAESEIAMLEVTPDEDGTNGNQEASADTGNIVDTVSSHSRGVRGAKDEGSVETATGATQDAGAGKTRQQEEAMKVNP